jgi:predicted nucleic acid-binding protein
MIETRGVKRRGSGRGDVMPVLDTTFLIDARRHPRKFARVIERIAEEDEAHVVPMQSAVEFAAGTRDRHEAFRELEESFTLRPFDEDIAREAARLAREAYGAGVFPGWADVQIAATATYEGMYVVTRNVKHVRDALGVRAWDYVNEDAPPQ